MYPNRILVCILFRIVTPLLDIWSPNLQYTVAWIIYSNSEVTSTMHMHMHTVYYQLGITSNYFLTLLFEHFKLLCNAVTKHDQTLPPPWSSNLDLNRLSWLLLLIKMVCPKRSPAFVGCSSRHCSLRRTSPPIHPHNAPHLRPLHPRKRQCCLPH